MAVVGGALVWGERVVGEVLVVLDIAVVVWGGWGLGVVRVVAVVVVVGRAVVVGAGVVVVVINAVVVGARNDRGVVGAL